jgi:hypothetical protein
MKFEDICSKGRCQVCNKETDVVVLSSAYGAISFAYCKDCCLKGLEPYDAIVSYISCAGHFPEDVNEMYVEDVRRILKELNISEEKFIKDCEKCAKQLDDYYSDAENFYFDEDELFNQDVVESDITIERG